MNNNKVDIYRNKWVPYQWPWTDSSGQKYSSFGRWAYSRKFSIIFTIAIWIILAILGYAGRSNCEGSWEIRFMCEWSMWMKEYKTNFFHFLITSFTTAWFHNDFAHILFVTVFGFVFPVQSFEEQHGTKATLFIFFFTYVLIGIFNGALFNILNIYWSDTKFVSYGFSRAWMGGSVGIFALIGGLSFFSKKKWFLYSLIFSFEVLNHFIIGNNIYISFIHITSASFGWLQCWLWVVIDKNKT